MKKYFLSALIFLVICPFAFSQEQQDSVYPESIYLNGEQQEEIEYYKNHADINKKTYDLKINKEYGRVTPQNISSYNDFNPYSSKSTSFSKEKKAGNFSFGTQQNYTFSPDSYTRTNTLFTKYQKDKFSVNTSYQNTGLPTFEQQRKGTLMFAPEYKINDHFSLQNRVSNSFLDKSRKNEVIFSIKPFKDNRMNFDIGAGRVYSETALPNRSQLNFSTKFHF